MKYLLTLYGDESQYGDRTPEEAAASMAAWDSYTNETKSAGALLGGEGLQPSETATTVEIKATGEQIVSDGPFAESKEQLAGFYLLECANLDEALEWAKKIPMPGGTVEVRPVMDYEARGSDSHTNSAEAVA